MPTTDTRPPSTRPAHSRAQRAERAGTLLTVGAGLLGVFLVGAFVFVAFLQEAEPSVYDDSLPNPMGGLARTAPGETSGEVELAGLRIDGAEVAMGEVELGITYVPQWTVTNPTDETVTFTTAMPQVLEGCCPGPVYASEQLVEAGDPVEVPPDGSVELSFPLQMHDGMGGWHHLTVPLVTPDGQEMVDLQVTADFPGMSM